MQIINLAKNIKTPSLTVYLVGEAAKDREAAKNVQCSLEYTTLRRVTEATEIDYDPDPEASPRPGQTTMVRALHACQPTYMHMPPSRPAAPGLVAGITGLATP